MNSNTAEKENNCHSELVSESKDGKTLKQVQGDRAGYKKTKLGWIPQEWDMIEFGELFKEVTNLSNDLSKFPLYSLTLEKGVTPKTERYERSHLLKNKDENEFKLISFNQIALNPMNLRYGAFFKSKVKQTVALSIYYNIIEPKNVELNVDYYDLLMRSSNAKRLYQRIATGTLEEKKRVHLSELNRQFVPYPEIPEQQKIAEILTKWDNAIEATEKLIETKQKRKKALMQRLLTGKLRFPDFAGQEWQTVKLKDIFDRVNRKNIEDNHNILTISAQQGLVSQEEFYNKRIASVDTSKYILIENGEFAYNKSYSKGYPMGAIKRLDRYPKGVVSSLYICFALNNDNNESCYFMHYFEAGLLNNEIQMVAQEGARNHGLLNINPTDFFNTMLKIPPSIEEQQKIAAVLNSCDREIELLKQKLNKLNEQKKGLMQKLLTGQVRVKVDKEVG